MKLPFFLKTLPVIVLLVVGFAMFCQAQNTLDEERFMSLKLTNEKGTQAVADWNTEINAQKVVFFWATWCKPCIMEMEAVHEAVQKGKISADKVHFITYEPINKVQAFLEKRSLQGLQVYTMDAQLIDLGIQSIPFAAVLNEKGEMVQSETGYRSNAHTVSFVKKYVEY
ncbi:TlpA disulfide reductase family protein [Cytophagales bacterium LB-30]|uniref:TlpA disulfide reductase family protein n=1 Tax=Shiella aurantiaca TaxID=3058365 RepID=A0ABT8F2R1_9BACT|nr:TlpA disulfide reductase family protein [Shiella aurantiaca]MDN4164740.1 TlpA disulfide reductase family protein [Shiella aurantiaca]